MFYNEQEENKGFGDGLEDNEATFQVGKTTQKYGQFESHKVTSSSVTHKYTSESNFRSVHAGAPPQNSSKLVEVKQETYSAQNDETNHIITPEKEQFLESSGDKVEPKVNVFTSVAEPPPRFEPIQREYAVRSFFNLISNSNSAF